MLHTNLLPEQEKKIIVTEQWLRVVKFFGIAASGILIIGLTLLAPSYLPLYFQSRELKRALSIQNDAARRINADQIRRDASQIKSVINSLHQTIDRPNGALSIFDLLTALRPGILITAFSVNKKAGISMTGNAATRSDLLLFEQYLRDSSRFQDITSPLTNIIQETNINFTFKGTLKPSYAL